MQSNPFIGRTEDIEYLRSVLQEKIRTGRKLLIQSIEGPGGIGKTYLIEHVLASTDLKGRKYLRLNINGNNTSVRGLVSAVSRMVDSATAEAIRSDPPGKYFPKVNRTIKAIETIKADVINEYRNRYPQDREGQSLLSQTLDDVFTLGRAFNDISPITKKYVNVEKLEKSREQLMKTIPTMTSLLKENLWFFEVLGIGNRTALRNTIKENACRPLSNALVADLLAILAGYPSKEWFKPAPVKINGIDRLLLVVDDYEKLQKSLGEFLVSYFFPALRDQSFESVVVIIGRDQLQATHPAWDQHLKMDISDRPVKLKPWSRQETDGVLEYYGIRASNEKDRAWKETEGYPLNVQLWIEEFAEGGQTAVMLKRFYDRITRWMSDEEKIWLQHILFLEEVNKKSLESILGNSMDASRAFHWFEEEGSIRETTGKTFILREHLRSRLKEYLRISDPDRYEKLQEKGQIVVKGR